MANGGVFGILNGGGKATLERIDISMDFDNGNDLTYDAYWNITFPPYQLGKGYDDVMITWWEGWSSGTGDFPIGTTSGTNGGPLYCTWEYDSSTGEITITAGNNLFTSSKDQYYFNCTLVAAKTS